MTARKPAKARSKPAPKNARPKPKRQRRTSEVAQEQILDAAERRFGAAGTGGLRLQQLAADIGVSHSTILHHFGSREALVQAVVTRALEGLQQKLVAAFSGDAFGPEDGERVFRQIMATLGERGHARLMAWLALEGRASGDPNRMLRALAELMHARRVDITGRRVALEDTLFVTLLGALALFAEGILGDSMFDSAGVGDAEARARFHDWFLKLIDRHLHGPGLIDDEP